MSDIRILALGDGEVVLARNEVLQAELIRNASAIDILWSRAKTGSATTLFNGRLAALSSMEVGESNWRMEIDFVEFRQFKAQREGLDLGIIPVGVSGIVVVEVEGDRAVVLARRSDDVELYPGAYELVPSGGMDSDAMTPDGGINPVTVLLKEFEEEVGVGREAISDVKFLAVIEDVDAPVVDLCYILTSKISFSALSQGLAASSEYSDAFALPLAQVAKFIDKKEGEIVPTSRKLLESAFC